MPYNPLYANEADREPQNTHFHWGEVSFPFLLLGIRKKLPVEGHVGFKHNAIGYKLYYLIE